MKPRADLLALGREALAKLTNLGLVKRAEREIAYGLGPTLAQDDAGVVRGVFPDAAIAELQPGRALEETPCSCGASGACRHRVAVALAYPEWFASQSLLEAREPSGSSRASPAAISDAEIERRLGDRTVARARAAIRRGLLAEIDDGDPPTAKLPTCAVRFLVPDDLGYARCECAIGALCEHVALACWAFREAERTGKRRVAFERAIDPGADEVIAIAIAIVREGVAHVDAGFGPRFARARDAAGDAVWLVAIVDDLEALVASYRARSARYSPSLARPLLASLVARARAAANAAELPARYLLGRGEAKETLLDRARLVGLGARVEADDRARSASVFFADPIGGGVLVLEKRWDAGAHERVAEGPELARRAIAGRFALGALARGEIVSRAVKRRANRSIAIGAARSGQTAIAAPIADWSALSPSIALPDVDALAARMAALPPRLLRPRVLAETLQVIAIARARDVRRLPGAQAIVATLEDARGRTLRLERVHRRSAPHALDAIAAALADPGLRFVSGDVRHDAAGLTIDPVALAVGDAIVVPDLAIAPAATVPVAAAPVIEPSPIATALADAETVLDDAVHAGLVRVAPSFDDRARAAADALEGLGLVTIAAALRALAVARAPEAWLDAAIAIDVAAEIAARGDHLSLGAAAS